MKSIKLILLVILLSGCAYKPYTSDLAQVGDVASTAIAIGNGAVEANPVAAALIDLPGGYGLLLGLKLALNHGFRQLDPDSCRMLIRLHTSAGWGLTANNLLVAAGVATAWPTLVVVGVGYWIAVKDYPECGDE